MKLFFSFVMALTLSLVTLPAGAAKPNAFAQCLADKGAIMYSAWWCPYCYIQLHMIAPESFTVDLVGEIRKMRSGLGRGDPKQDEKLGEEWSEKLRQFEEKIRRFEAETRNPDALASVPFVRECSSHNTRAFDVPECKNTGIAGTPTWMMGGKQLGQPGTKTLRELSQATGCPL